MRTYIISTPHSKHFAVPKDEVITLILRDYLPKIGLKAPAYGALARNLVVWLNDFEPKMAPGDEEVIYKGEIRIRRER